MYYNIIKNIVYEKKVPKRCVCPEENYKKSLSPNIHLIYSLKTKCLLVKVKFVIIHNSDIYKS